MADRVEVVVGVLVREGRVLLAQRDPRRSDWGHFWECPGGKVEPGEDPRRALSRERREELAVVAEVGDPLFGVPLDYPYVKRPARVTFYRVPKWYGTPQPCSALGLGWFMAQEVVGLLLAPANDAARKRLCRLLQEGA
jgi:8-oxo-dGTP diphosphatase